MMTCTDNPPVEKKVSSRDLAAPPPPNAKLNHMRRVIRILFGLALRSPLSTLHLMGEGAVSVRVDTFFFHGVAGLVH